MVKIMGRDIRVLKRWGFDPGNAGDKPEVKAEDDTDTRERLAAVTGKNAEPALWGLDLEALRSSNGPKATSSSSSTTPGGLPIYTAHSARAYLLKSFNSKPSSAVEDAASKTSPKKKTFTAVVQERERNLGLLLGALHLLYSSWAPFIGKDELDRRAWQWYVHVRPDVETGVAGWGGKGEVPLQSILDLRRKG